MTSRRHGLVSFAILAGAFAWELSGDTAHSDLLTAIANGLAEPS